MSAVVVLDWKFSPPDYFEEPIEISRHDYTMSIADGKVQAKIDSALFDVDASMRQRLHDGLNDRFLAVQMLTHRAYELSGSTKTRLHPDGRRDVFVELEPARIVMTGHPIDVQVRDRNGNVLVDSKRDRIEKKKSLADLVSTYRASDGTLASLLRSHDAAVRDPNNELVHLYEVREALTVKFGGEKGLRSTLSISSPNWSRFGELCNSEPLRQGRHRGRAGGALRDATEAELEEARGIARAMTEAYLQYLDASSPKGG